MNRKDRRAAEARPKTTGTAGDPDRDRMVLMMRNEGAIRRVHEAARATLGADVIVVLADPTDPLGRTLSVNQQTSDEEVGALIASEAHGPPRRVVISTLRREDALRLMEPGTGVAATALRAWSPDTGRILVMCVVGGGITVSELGLGGGDGADAKRIRADILGQSIYGIHQARTEARTRGLREVVVIVADTRDPTGRSVALSSGIPASGIDAMIASAMSKGGLPILMVGKPRDEVIQSMQRSLPLLVAILKSWSPAGHEFPVICFAAGGETMEMLADSKVPRPLGQA